MPGGQTFYESPPGSGNNDGALPSAFIPGWWTFKNLTADQVLAFQGFPQDLLQYLASRRQLAEWSGVTVAGIPLLTQDKDQAKVDQMMHAFDRGVITTQPFFDGVGNVHVVNAAQASMIYSAVVGFVSQTFVVAKQLFDGITATPPTITTRKQIDAELAVVAPNSPSATNPSPN